MRKYASVLWIVVLLGVISMQATPKKNVITSPEIVASLELRSLQGPTDQVVHVPTEPGTYRLTVYARNDTPAIQGVAFEAYVDYTDEVAARSTATPFGAPTFNTTYVVWSVANQPITLRMFAYDSAAYSMFVTVEKL